MGIELGLQRRHGLSRVATASRARASEDQLGFARIGIGEPFMLARQSAAFVAFAVASFVAATRFLDRQQSRAFKKRNRKREHWAFVIYRRSPVARCMLLIASKSRSWSGPWLGTTLRAACVIALASGCAPSIENRVRGYGSAGIGTDGRDGGGPTIPERLSLDVSPIQVEEPVAVGGNLQVQMQEPIGVEGSVRVQVDDPVAMKGDVRMRVDEPIAVDGKVRMHMEEAVDLNGNVRVALGPLDLRWPDRPVRVEGNILGKRLSVDWGEHPIPVAVTWPSALPELSVKLHGTTNGHECVERFDGRSYKLVRLAMSALIRAKDAAPKCDCTGVFLPPGYYGDDGNGANQPLPIALLVLGLIGAGAFGGVASVILGRAGAPAGVPAKKGDESSPTSTYSSREPTLGDHHAPEDISHSQGRPQSDREASKSNALQDGEGSPDLRRAVVTGIAASLTLPGALWVFRAETVLTLAVTNHIYILILSSVALIVAMIGRPFIEFVLAATQQFLEKARNAVVK